MNARRAAIRMIPRDSARKVLREKREGLLKRVWLAAVLLCAASRASSAQEASQLAVGMVRDREGTAVTGASVQAFDANGRSVGTDRTDNDGTFAVKLSATAARLDVKCRHCRPKSVRLDGQTDVVLVVTRYRALENDVPDASDLAALPFGRIVDVLALAPYVLPSLDDTAVSDRGLNRGQGLPVVALAPMADLSTGVSGFEDVPDRYPRSIALAPASKAFRYGNGAGGGVFWIDQLDPERSNASADVGNASGLVLEPRVDVVYPAAGVSSDGGTSIRRADLDVESGFAGGVLRVGGTSASSTSAPANLAPTDLDAARIAYSTQSRRYRTFADFSASDLGIGESAGGPSGYRSTYINGDFRLERPGPVELDAGATTQRQSGSYSLGQPQPYTLTGRFDDDTIYLEAHAAAGTRGRLDAGLGLSDVVQRASLPAGPLHGEKLALMPSIAGRLELGAGLAVRAGFSESLRSPTLQEAFTLQDSETAPPANGGVELERGELAETALEYDTGRRLRGEVTLFSEYLHGLGDRRLDGIGASLVWQVTPLISLRTWSLRDDPVDFTTGSLQGDVSRQLAWATYENPAGLRFDAIMTRDAGLDPGAIGLDGDVLIPLVPHAALDLGTSRRAGVRSYVAGLRFR
jgi:hypothetical protein